MGFVASKQLASPRCWRGEVGLGASKDPLNQWCISHISPYFSKIYQLALYFSFWGFPLLWPWCTYEVMNHALQISLLGKGTTTWGRHRVWSVNGFTFIVSACEGSVQFSPSSSHRQCWVRVLIVPEFVRGGAENWDMISTLAAGIRTFDLQRENHCAMECGKLHLWPLGPMYLFVFLSVSQKVHKPLNPAAWNFPRS